MRLIRRPMRPAIKCVIVSLLTNKPIAYNFTDKRIFRGMGTDYTVFPSRTQARKALWHICQDPDIDQMYKIVPVK